MTTLQDVTTPRDGILTVPEGWRQQRGAYGGLTIAAAIRAIEAHVGDPARKVRSVTAELPAPTLPGPATVAVETLKSGSNLTCARATLAQNGTVTTHAVAILAADRDGTTDMDWCDLAPPIAPPPDTLKAIPLSSGLAWPEFAVNFEYRLVDGIPFASLASKDGATVVGYVRALDPGPARDAAYIAAMIDVWWPAIFSRMQRPRPMATIAFTLELVSTLDGEDPAAPLLYRGTVPLVRGGYFQETRELWTPSGRLLARNHQTFAIIK